MKLNVNDSPLEYKSDILALWKDTGIQKAVQRSSEFHLLDSAPYFLEAGERILVSTYEPNTQDILRSRIATTGIIETEFMIDKLLFRMYDVGGQRGERKKWIHCFENVTAIMFIASLSEYDQVLAEDRCRNRLKESLDLFEGIINLPWFKDAPIILFLNKDDLFRKKIESVDIGIYFPQYTGGTDYSLGLKFIQDEYFARNLNEQKTIYCFSDDTEVLTNRGFLNRIQVKEALLKEEENDGGVEWTTTTTTLTYTHTSHRRRHPSTHSPIQQHPSSQKHEPLLFASYDPNTGCISYQRATHFIEKQDTLIDVTSQNERSRWKEEESSSSSRHKFDSNHNYISLRISPSHDMYLTTGKQQSDNVDPVEYDGHVAWSQDGYHKVKASTLLTQDAGAWIKMKGCATGGLGQQQHDDLMNLEFVRELQFETEKQVCTFLSLYGYWLGRGSLSTTSSDSFLSFHPNSIDEKLWILENLNSIGLQQGYEIVSNSIEIRIHIDRWVSYFTRIYGGEDDHQFFASWVWQLSRNYVRMILDGLRLAQSGSVQVECADENVISTSSIRFRDELIRLAFHGGYSAIFELSGEGIIDNEISPSSNTNTTLTTSWNVYYRDSTPACEPLIHLADEVTASPEVVTVWCVTVPPTNLIVARRAFRDPAHGDAVTRASMPIIVGNCHVTDATNTENIAFVWKATKHIILEQNLTRSGLLMC